MRIFILELYHEKYFYDDFDKLLTKLNHYCFNISEDEYENNKKMFSYRCYEYSIFEFNFNENEQICFVEYLNKNDNLIFKTKYNSFLIEVFNYFNAIFNKDKIIIEYNNEENYNSMLFSMDNKTNIIKFKFMDKIKFEKF